MKFSRYFALLLLLYSGVLVGHEIRPAYLQIVEQNTGIYQIFWKVPLRGNEVLRLYPEFPSHCQQVTALGSGKTGFLRDNRAFRWAINCHERGLLNQQIRIAGLEYTLTDVLVHFEAFGEQQTSFVVRPENPVLVLDEHEVFSVPSYFLLGMKHILQGFDHLLFVFALLLLISGIKPLLLTITAFTLAHSLSLGLSTLGYVTVAQEPVEIMILLSILLLARDILRPYRNEPQYLHKYPWIMAFVFGLLHGLGFASALNDIGLEQDFLFLSLLLFNAGIETGQLLFILVVLALISGLRYLFNFSYRRLVVGGAYVLGGISVYWLIAYII